MIMKTTTETMKIVAAPAILTVVPAVPAARGDAAAAIAAAIKASRRHGTIVTVSAAALGCSVDDLVKAVRAHRVGGRKRLKEHYAGWDVRGPSVGDKGNCEWSLDVTP